MKKPSLDDSLMDYLQYLYLADIIERESILNWDNAKTLARRLLDEMNEVPNIFK
jgi:hypothetical protein